MSPEDERYLSRCNALAKFGRGEWCPVEKDGDYCFSPNGFRLGAPDEVKAMPLTEIVKFMDANGFIPYRRGV